MLNTLYGPFDRLISKNHSLKTLDLVLSFPKDALPASLAACRLSGFDLPKCGVNVLCCIFELGPGDNRA